MSGGRGRRDPVVDLERDLLARLGLGADTTPERVESAHDAVVDFLASAPGGLRAWARTQAAAADNAFALLSDPAALAHVANRASPPAAPAERTAKEAQAAAAAGSAPVRAATAVRPSRSPRGTNTAARAGSVDEIDELIAEVTPSAHREEVTRLASRPAAPATTANGPSWRLPVLRLTAVVAAAVVLVGIALFVYNDRSAPITSAADATAAPTPTATLDEAQVAALMAKVQANPKDTDALMDLGDTFFQVGQYKVAADWLAKVVAIDSKNVRALLALGAADFNAGSTTDAEKYWKQAVGIDPKNVEAHYDLGFLYLQKQPVDIAGMQREWQTVVDLAPGTEVAKSVQAHLDALASPAPSGSALPGAAASGSSLPSGASSATPSAQP